TSRATVHRRANWRGVYLGTSVAARETARPQQRRQDKMEKGDSTSHGRSAEFDIGKSLNNEVMTCRHYADLVSKRSTQS
ncbi:MAG: hypothetical protein L0228_17535, partial [Planctomycetes bacterium]|nr:hypothetical protein [Planctomycetota bacterium]